MAGRPNYPPSPSSSSLIAFFTSQPVCGELSIYIDHTSLALQTQSRAVICWESTVQPGDVITALLREMSCSSKLSPAALFQPQGGISSRLPPSPDFSSVVMEIRKGSFTDSVSTGMSWVRAHTPVNSVSRVPRLQFLASLQ